MAGGQLLEVGAGDHAVAPPARPWLTILITWVVLIASSASTLAPIGKGLPYLIGSAVGGALIFFGIAWLIRLRKASRGWAIGAFSLFFVTAFVVQLAKAGDEFNRIRNDVKTIAGARIEDDGTVTLTSGGAEAGPLQRVMAAGIERQAIIRDRYQADVKAIDLDKILTANSGIAKRDCGAVSALLLKVEGYRKESAGLAPKLRADLAAMALDEGLKAEVLRGFDQSRAANDARTEKTWNLEADAVRAAASACRVVTASRWRAAGVNFEFYDTSAANEYNRYAQALDAAAKAQQAILGEARTSLKQAQDKLAPLTR